MALVKLTRQQIDSALQAPGGRNIPAGKRDEMAIPSYTHANPLIRWLMWRRYAVINELARLGPGDSALEFGCGIGLFLPTLSKRAAAVYAVDLFTQYAGKLSSEMGLGVRFVDSVSEIPDGSLSLIVAADVLEHIDNVEDYLRLFRAKLVPGGQFIVSGPTENIIYKLGRIAAGFGGKGDYHLTNIDRLAAQIESCGFRLERQRTLPFRVPPFLFRIIEFSKEAA